MAAWRRLSCLLDLRPLVNSRNLSDVSILNASICQSARSEFLQPYEEEIYKMKMNKKNGFKLILGSLKIASILVVLCKQLQDLSIASGVEVLDHNSFN